jgi:hypothetical protein
MKKFDRIFHPFTERLSIGQITTNLGTTGGLADAFNYVKFDFNVFMDFRLRKGGQFRSFPEKSKSFLQLC